MAVADGTVYATVDEVEARWHAMSDTERARCEALLVDASDLIRSWNPDAESYASAATLRRVACQAVIRALSAGDMVGVTQGSQTVGPVTESWSYGSGSGAGSGDLWLTAQERRSIGAGVQRAWSLDMMEAES